MSDTEKSQDAKELDRAAKEKKTRESLIARIPSNFEFIDREKIIFTSQGILFSIQGNEEFTVERLRSFTHVSFEDPFRIKYLKGIPNKVKTQITVEVPTIVLHHDPANDIPTVHFTTFYWFMKNYSELYAEDSEIWDRVINKMKKMMPGCELATSVIPDVQMYQYKTDQKTYMPGNSHALREYKLLCVSKTLYGYSVENNANYLELLISCLEPFPALENFYLHLVHKYGPKMSEKIHFRTLPPAGDRTISFIGERVCLLIIHLILATASKNLEISFDQVTRKRSVALCQAMGYRDINISFGKFQGSKDFVRDLRECKQIIAPILALAFFPIEEDITITPSLLSLSDSYKDYASKSLVQGSFPRKFIELTATVCKGQGMSGFKNIKDFMSLTPPTLAHYYYSSIDPYVEEYKLVSTHFMEHPEAWYALYLDQDRVVTAAKFGSLTNLALCAKDLTDQNAKNIKSKLKNFGEFPSLERMLQIKLSGTGKEYEEIFRRAGANTEEEKKPIKEALDRFYKMLNL